MKTVCSGGGSICVSVSAANGETLLAEVAPVLDLVDAVEIRLDGMDDPEIGACIAALPKPVLATNRPAWEGGRWRGGEEERVALLEQCLRWGARWVDIELRSDPMLQRRLLRAAQHHGARLIVSYHDFQGTPDSEHLRATMQAIRETGADIGKIVTTAVSPLDALRVLQLQEQAAEARLPLIAFAMGAHGAVTRLATLYLGGYMTYAALSHEQATAPGQLTLHELHDLIQRLPRTP